MLIHNVYFTAAGALIIWQLALIGIRFTEPSNVDLLIFWDALMNLCGSSISACSLLFAICYTKEYESNLPKQYYLLFVIPVVTFFVILTNNAHHLFYKVFSFKNTTVEFGAYFIVHSIFSFSCVALSVIMIIRFAIKTKTRLHIVQAILFTIGSIAPSVANCLALSNVFETSVILTPICFIVTMFFHGIIIYGLHMFDIKPIAMQQLIKWIGDCYLVTSQSGIVVSYNRPFMELLGYQHSIRENLPLQDCIRNEDVENKTAIYNLITAIRSCQESNTKVIYEQAISKQKDNETVKYFYMSEVIPLNVKGETCGFLSIFRDITQVKADMQRLQDSQVKMIEQERLAFLGQMVGGLAHNLKTPIMSVSGSVTAVESLIQECEESNGDPDVTPDDYHEIYQEVNVWLERMRDACAYMSDIISAVKGQASNMNLSDRVDFSLKEALKRVSLLLRHELLNSGCTFIYDYNFERHDVLINGDINNLVQVITNLVSNAIDAQVENGNHNIIADIKQDVSNLQIIIKDFGTGIPENIRKKLFQQMITSKGTQGTGLGIFISNTVIHAKFDGTMWFEDNPEGGTIWGISLPLSNVTIRYLEKVGTNEKE